MTALVAALLTFVYVDQGGPAGARGDALRGKVLLSSTERGGAGRAPPSETLTIPQANNKVETHCWAEGAEVEILRVVAKRSDGTGKTYNLGWEVVEGEAGGGAAVKVTADLALGVWSLSCEVEERSSRTRSWIGPATLTVKNR